MSFTVYIYHIEKYNAYKAGKDIDKSGDIPINNEDMNCLLDLCLTGLAKK